MSRGLALWTRRADGHSCRPVSVFFSFLPYFDTFIDPNHHSDHSYSVKNHSIMSTETAAAPAIVEGEKPAPSANGAKETEVGEKRKAEDTAASDGKKCGGPYSSLESS